MPWSIPDSFVKQLFPFPDSTIFGGIKRDRMRQGMCMDRFFLRNIILDYLFFYSNNYMIWFKKLTSKFSKWCNKILWIAFAGNFPLLSYFMESWPCRNVIQSWFQGRREVYLYKICAFLCYHSNGSSSKRLFLCYHVTRYNFWL